MNDYKSVRQHALKGGHSRMCAPIAVALTTGVHFDKVHHHMLAKGYRKSKRSGTKFGGFVHTIRDLGFNIGEVSIPRGAKTNVTLAGKLPEDRKFIVQYSGHIAAYVNGKIEDWTEGRRNRIIKIYEVY